MIVNSEALYDLKPLVTVKGTRDGLLFLLDEHAEMDDLCTYITDLLSGEAGKVFDGPQVEVVVDYGKRIITAGEGQRLLKLFLERENFLLKAWGGSTAARQSLYYRKAPGRNHTVFRGVVRAGEPLSFDGDVVIIGDVNPSAEVRATGDIYVFGRLLGIAHAGFDGDRNSVIAATEFAPMQLRIHDVVSRAPTVQEQPLQAFMEFAYLENGHLAIAEMRHFNSYDRSRRELTDVRRKGSRQ